MIYNYLMAGAPDPPTDLNATQVGPTSIRVSWTAPVSGAAVTGYGISYSGGTDQGTVNVGASATEHTITITPPQSRLTYSISIITLSSSFPSSMAGPILVTVGKCMQCLCILHVCVNHINAFLFKLTYHPLFCCHTWNTHRLCEQ